MLLENATTTVTSTAVKAKNIRSVQASGTTSAGSGAATVYVEVSNDNVNWIPAFIITLTLGTTSTADGQRIVPSWELLRVRISAISGTNASVNVVAGDGTTI